MIEEDPNAKKASKKAYGGSHTTRFDYPEHVPHSDNYSYNTGASTNRYHMNHDVNKHPTAYSMYSNPHATSCTTAYHHPHSISSTGTYNNPHVYSNSQSSLGSGSKKPKSRFKKYAGAKTSYGDMGGSSYTSQPNYESGRYMNSGYGGSHVSKHNQYAPSYTEYTPAKQSAASSTGYQSGANARYGGTTNYSDYNRYHGDTGYHKDYGSGSTHPAYSSSASYYQPVSSRPYGANSHYQPHYADVKPAVVDTRPTHHQVDSASKPQQSLREKEETPEHNVSASIEEKASKYGGKYQTSDGKIYYGGKPKKYSSKKSKKYHNRRKTMHADQYHPEKSDRPSV